MKSKIIYYIITALLLSIIFTGPGLADADLIPDLNSSRYITATSTHFELNNTKYPDLTIDSSNPVNLTFISVPKMVKLRFEPINSAPITHITLNGLTPLTTYYKVEDDYHNMTVFTTDSNGRYTYAQDNMNEHYVFILPGSGDMTIQSGSNIKFINDSVTGGDCTSIGNWDPGTNTCTLTTDFSGTIQIDSDDITLDGDGHTLTGSNTGDGIFIRDNSGFTIKDLEIHDFAYGICCMDYYIGDLDHENYITDNNIYDNDEGICFGDWYDYSKTIINRNMITNNDDGIFLHFSNRNITIMDNNINNNGWGIVSFDMSMDNTIINNTIYENSIGIIFDQSCCENITNNYIFNNFGTGVCLSMTGGHSIKDNIISNNQNGITLGGIASGNDITGNTISNNDHGIHVHSGMEDICDNTINANIISNNDFGIYIKDSGDTYSGVHDNYITSNTVSNNNYGIYVLEAYDNFFYYNDLFSNTINNAYENLGSGNNDWDNGSIGNRYSNYDEPCEGCIDNDNNGICDFDYAIPGGSGIDHHPMVHWMYEWTGDGSDGGSTVTTNELQVAIHLWLEDIPVTNHILSIEDIQLIITLWMLG